MNEMFSVTLYKEALTYAYNVVGSGGDALSEHQRGFVSAGKYAELIVAECARLCRDQAASAEYSYTPAKSSVARMTAEDCATLIERRFSFKAD